MFLATKLCAVSVLLITFIPNKSVKYEFLSQTSRNPHWVWHFGDPCCINMPSSGLPVRLAQSSKWQESSNSVFPISIHEFNIKKEGEAIIWEEC